jgi:beta-glucosidase
MGAYNGFRGEHLCENRYLLTDVLKREWGFKGFVMSDFQFRAPFHSPRRPTQASTFVEMASTKYFGVRLVRAVRAGRVDPARVADACERVTRTVQAFVFDKKGKPFPAGGDPGDPHTYELRSALGRAVPASACEEHVALALEVAIKSIVLAQNRDESLPWRSWRSWPRKMVLVLGSLADADNTGDHGSSRVLPPYVVTPLQGQGRRAALAGSGVEVCHYAGKGGRCGKPSRWRAAPTRCSSWPGAGRTTRASTCCRCRSGTGWAGTG